MQHLLQIILIYNKIKSLIKKLTNAAIIIKYNEAFSLPLDFITEDKEEYRNIKNTPEKIIFI